MTDLVIIKRDGRKVDFDPSKIYHAVDQAMTAIGLRKVSAASNEESINTFADQVTHLVTDKIEHLQVASISVEQIQDLVEETLIEQNRSDIAKHYIVYRQQRSDAREINSSTNEMIDHILHVTSADDDDKRENGNINTDAVMGSMLKIGSSVTKNYNLAKLLNPKHVKMHRDGVIHMHDLDFMSLCANCLFIPLNKLLRDGFSTGHGFLRSPTTIRSAAALTCIAIQSSQNDMFGGQAIPSFDYYLAPYVAKSFVRHFSDYLEIVTSISDTVRKEYFIRPLDAFIMKHNGIYKYRDEVKAQYDILRAQPCLEEDKNVDTEQQFTDAWKYAERKTIQETQQAMEALTHNLCSMQSRAGSQTPFSSVNFGLDTSWEGRLISSEVLDAGYAGLGHGETALFPITIFKMKKGVNDKGSPNYDLFQKACKVTALRMLPNFVNVDAPFNLEYYQPDRPETHVATMGCVHGTETSLWKLDDKIEVSDFGRMSRILMNKYPLIQYSEISHYMDLEKADIGIWDSFNNKFAKVKKFIINQNVTDWVIVKLDDESTLTITPDHPLPVEGRGRIRADELKRGDRIKHSINEKLYTGSDEFATVLSIEKASIGSISETTSYDVETDTDRFDLDSIQSHNCRTRVLSNVYDKNHVQTDGRGNLFWTTINMPYLALEAKEQAGDIITNFFRRLDEVIDDVIDFSHDRFNIIAHRKAYNFPFLMGQHEYVGSDELLPDDDIREVIKNGTIAIGFIGLAETLLTLVGKHHGESDEAQALGLKIIQHMKDRADRQTKLENINYSVMGSPAEGCTGRLCKAIKKRWGVIPGITDKPYLVNSTHIPPSYKTTLVHKVEIEAPYHALCLGGHIWYGEIDANTAANVEAVERIVTYIASKGCGYFSLNHPMMRDPICGYVGAPAPDGSCPRCGRKEFEGVAAWKLLQLRSYSPDPEYLVRSDMITYEDTMPEPNSLEGLSVED